jgi:hypothetical protein
MPSIALDDGFSLAMTIFGKLLDGSTEELRCDEVIPEMERMAVEPPPPYP